MIDESQDDNNPYFRFGNKALKNDADDLNVRTKSYTQLFQAQPKRDMTPNPGQRRGDTTKSEHYHNQINPKATKTKSILEAGIQTPL